MLPELLLPWPPPVRPALPWTASTPGRFWRMSRPMRSTSDCVAAMLDPTGSRTEIWKRDSSSTGVKLIPDAR